MAISHAQPGQVVDVSPPGDEVASERTTALFKSRDLEVIRLVLKAGRSLPPHKVTGEITIHCLEGAISVSADDGVHALREGQLLYLKGGETHGVTAAEDSIALVTIALVTLSAQ